MTNLKCCIAALLWVVLLLAGCRNLDESPTSAVTPDNFYQTEGELTAAVVPVYASLKGFSWGDPMTLQEVASDEIYVPQRGGDWGDNNVWKDVYRHEWKPTLGFINGAWTSCYQGVARANSVLESLQSSSSTSTLVPRYIAQVKVLRAYYYWWLMDLFGGVPIVTAAATDPDNPPEQNTRQEVYDFVISEITSSLPDLTDAFDPYIVTKGAANAILATVYLNAEVYTGTPRWSECIAACDAVINSGHYTLLSNVADNFDIDNEGNFETIWAVGHEHLSGVGFNRHMASLHYNQLPQTPWNGWSVVSDFYNKYDEDDARRDLLLEGPQLVLAGPNAGLPALDRQGAPLVFTVEVGNLDAASEGEGVRVLKWNIDPSQSGGDAGNDFAIYRYSTILLTKAEALLMQGDAGGALDLVNQVRARAFEPDEPLGSVTRDDILNERGFELFWENTRRQDLIRTGHFEDSWPFKTDSNPIRRIYPIPQIQLDANPNLVQNTGY